MAGKGAQGEASDGRSGSGNDTRMRADLECTATLSALAQLAFNAMPVIPSPPRPAATRRTLSQTTDALPFPPAKRSRGQEASQEGEPLALLAVEALRQMAPRTAPPEPNDRIKTPLPSVAAATLALTSLLPTPLRRPMAMSEASGTTSSISYSSYSLSISQQPPARAVYKRIIRPFPSVSLVFAGPQSRPRGVTNLFVEVFLVDDNRPDVVLPYLDGTRVARVTDRACAIFTKLKVVCTSQMMKSTGVPGFVPKHFKQSPMFTYSLLLAPYYLVANSGRMRLLFILKEFTGSAFQAISSIRAVSSTMEIFSHTQYLQSSTDASDSASVLPVCSEILPASGKAAGGTRCVILGDGFEKSSSLCVRFGNAEPVNAEYHENGTLLVTTPAVQRGMVPVRVSNDGTRWSDSMPPIFFTFM